MTKREQLIDKFIERIKIDYPEDDKLMMDLIQFESELAALKSQEQEAGMDKWIENSELSPLTDDDLKKWGAEEILTDEEIKNELIIYLNKLTSTPTNYEIFRIEVAFEFAAKWARDEMQEYANQQCKDGKREELIKFMEEHKNITIPNYSSNIEMIVDKYLKTNN